VAGNSRRSRSGRSASGAYGTKRPGASGAWLYRSRNYLVHAQRGSELLNENKTEQAVIELQTAIRQPPDYVPAHFALAHAYFDKRQFTEAEAELKRVLELEPGRAPARYELGMVYLNQQRTQLAKDLFTQLLRADKDDAYDHLGLGMALAAEQNHQAAIEEYKTAAQLQAELSSVFYRIGISEAKLKNYDEAIAALRKQQDSVGDDFDTEAALADAYRAKSMAPEAEDAMRKAEKFKSGK
jgi:tetratricopeptide (TPR) repeat protein